MEWSEIELGLLCWKVGDYAMGRPVYGVEKNIISNLLNNSLSYTGCPRRNVQYFGRVFLMLNYTDITQNTYIQSW